MIVGFADLVEKTLDLIVARHWKQDHIAPTEEKVALVNQLSLILRNAHVYLVLADLLNIHRCRTIRVVERLTHRQIDRDLVFLGPWKVKVDRITSRTGAE